VEAQQFLCDKIIFPIFYPTTNMAKTKFMAADRMLEILCLLSKNAFVFLKVFNQICHHKILIL